MSLIDCETTALWTTLFEIQHLAYTTPFDKLRAMEQVRTETVPRYRKTSFYPAEKITSFTLMG